MQSPRNGGSHDERRKQNLESQRGTAFFSGERFYHGTLGLLGVALADCRRVVAALIAILVLPSIRIIGPTEIGLVTKRFAFKKLPGDNPIAFRGEAGYQADLLMPGWHVKLWVALHRREASLGAGAGGRDRSGGRTSGPAASHRRQIGRVGRRLEP